MAIPLRHSLTRTIRALLLPALLGVAPLLLAQTEAGAAARKPATPAPAADPAALFATPAATATATPAPALATTPITSATLHAPLLESEQRLSPGDLIRIRMVEDPLLAYEGLISASGTVPVPFYGEFMLARMTPAEASEALAAALTESVYEKATISVTLVTKGPGKVYVYGAVRRPGVVGMPTVGGLSIIQVLSFVEGMTSWASPEETFVIRRGKPGEPPQKITINLKEILSSSEALVSQDVQLQADDIICVPGIDGTLFFSTDVCEVIVTGEVRVPGIVPFAPGEQRTLMRAILKAGGFSKFARSDRVRLVRIEKGKDRQERTIDAGRIIEEGRVDLDIDLQPGDMIIIPLKAFAL